MLTLETLLCRGLIYNFDLGIGSLISGRFGISQNTELKNDFSASPQFRPQTPIKSLVCMKDFFSNSSVVLFPPRDVYDFHSDSLCLNTSTRFLEARISQSYLCHSSYFRDHMACEAISLLLWNEQIYSSYTVEVKTQKRLFICIYSTLKMFPVPTA